MVEAAGEAAFVVPTAPASRKRHQRHRTPAPARRNQVPTAPASRKRYQPIWSPHLTVGCVFQSLPIVGSGISSGFAIAGLLGKIFSAASASRRRYQRQHILHCTGAQLVPTAPASRKRHQLPPDPIRATHLEVPTAPASRKRHQRGRSQRRSARCSSNRSRFTEAASAVRPARQCIAHPVPTAPASRKRHQRRRA